MNDSDNTISEELKKRGITLSTWLTLKNSIYPGALDSSILMACDYCKARQLDVLKRPVHIVPMQVTEKFVDPAGHTQEKKVWRDVIMPGIAELRSTAFRSGKYMGHSEPSYGPEIVYMQMKVPEWCSITVYRNINGIKCEFPHTERFDESVATTSKGDVNRIWTKRPVGQLTKCTLAGALRDAFPEELGGLTTSEEMVERELTEEVASSSRTEEATKQLSDGLKSDLQTTISGDFNLPDDYGEETESHVLPGDDVGD